jgi:hypothetical protein
VDIVCANCLNIYYKYHISIISDMYNCRSCDKQFKRQENLDYHTNKKVCIGEDKYNCKYCMKGFANSNNMYRHMKHTCKVKKENEEEKNEIYMRLLKLEEELKRIPALEKQNKKLKKEVNEIKKNNRTTNNTVNGDMNINNGTVNNITLVAYGSEDLSKLDKMEMIDIFQNGYNSTLKLTEALHFNPKYPEYHNVYIANMKNKYAMLFDGTDWTLNLKEDLINKMYNDKRYYIEDNMDNFLDALTGSQIRSLNRWLDTTDDDKKIRDIKEKLKLMLYNKRNVPINSSNRSTTVHEPLIIKDNAIIECIDVKKEKPIKAIVKEKIAPKMGTKRKNYAKAVKINKKSIHYHFN